VTNLDWALSAMCNREGHGAIGSGGAGKGEGKGYWLCSSRVALPYASVLRMCANLRVCVSVD